MFCLVLHLTWLHAITRLQNTFSGILWELVIKTSEWRTHWVCFNSNVKKHITHLNDVQWDVAVRAQQMQNSIKWNYIHNPSFSASPFKIPFFGSLNYIKSHNLVLLNLPLCLWSPITIDIKIKVALKMWYIGRIKSRTAEGQEVLAMSVSWIAILISYIRIFDVFDVFDCFPPV